MIVNALPPSLTLILIEASLLIVGVVAEKYYVSRITSFTNAVALTIHVISQERVGFWMGFYVDIAVLIGIWGLTAYVLDKSLNSTYYDLSYFLFSSVNVALVIGLGSYSFVGALILGVLIQLVLLGVFDEDILVHFGEYPGSVKRFHEKNNLVMGRHEYDFSDWFK